MTASQKLLTLQALSSSLNAGLAKEGCLARGEAFGCPPAVCPAERPRPFTHYRNYILYEINGHMLLESGPEKRGHYERGLFTGGISKKKRLKSLNSLESLEDGRLLLYFPQSGGSLKL